MSMETKAAKNEAMTVVWPPKVLSEPCSMLPYVLGRAGAHIQEAGVVGNREQYAFRYQRQVGRAKDGPVARVEQEAKGAAAYQGGDHPVAREQHDRVHDQRARYHGGGEDEADGVVRPPVEAPVTGQPFTCQQAHDAKGGAKGQAVVHPQVVHDGGAVGDAHDRGYHRPPLTVFPVQPEVPVPRQQHEVHVVGSNQKDA